MIWKRLFSKKSSAEKGTLYQLRNVLNRSGVPIDPGDNMKGAEDFLCVLYGHIIAAVNNILSQSDVPSVTKLAEKIVENFVRITTPAITCDSSDKRSDQDQVHTYHRTVDTGYALA